MRLIPSIVKIGSPEFRGLLARFAPHPNIRKLREIAYFLYDTNKSIYQQRVHTVTQAENNGACEGKGRDIISVLSESGLSQDRGLSQTCHSSAKQRRRYDGQTIR
jgi:hypothetical protein